MTHPPAEFSGQEFSKLTTWLEPLTAVVLMLVSKDATLLHANKGGRRILEQIAPAGSRSDGVREFFVHPTLAELLAIDVSPGQAIFQGVINVGNSLAYCRSLSGAVFRDGDQLLLIGEYDIADMESMSSTVIELNGLLVSTQRELYRSNRKLQESEANLIALSRTDPLTGVANRRRLMEFLQLEIDRFGRHASFFRHHDRCRSFQKD